MDSYSPDKPPTADGSSCAWPDPGGRLVLDMILHAAEHLAPGAHVGITAASGAGTYTTLAGTDSLVFMLDEMQYDLDEGPGLTAMREGQPAMVDDTTTEHRWPRFMVRAQDVGLRSHLAMPICVDGKTLGGITMYSAAQTRVDVAWLPHARLFAAQAALALGQSRRENDLFLALQSSRAIGNAVGLVMERFGLNDHEAFEYLVTMSQRSNLKLRELAEHLVKQANDLRRVTTASRPLRHQQPWPSLTLVPAPETASGQDRG